VKSWGLVNPDILYRFKKYTNEKQMNYRMNKNREKNWGWYDNCEKLEGKVVSISLMKCKRLQL